MLVQLSGALGRPGIVEAPLGTSLRDLLDLAGGATGTLKALLVGGPTGGFLPAESLDLPLTFASLAEAGALVGSGTILAVGAETSIVELSTLLTRYLSDESCGKTIPCRIGLRRMAELGDGLCSGLCRPTDTEAHRGPGGGHPGRRPVRPRGRRRQPAAVRDAILRERVRRRRGAGLGPVRDRRRPDRHALMTLLSMIHLGARHKGTPTP